MGKLKEISTYQIKIPSQNNVISYYKSIGEDDSENIPLTF